MKYADLESQDFYLSDLLPQLEKLEKIVLETNVFNNVLRALVI